MRAALALVDHYMGRDFIAKKLVSEDGKEICLFLEEEWKILKVGDESTINGCSQVESKN